LLQYRSRRRLHRSRLLGMVGMVMMRRRSRRRRRRKRRGRAMLVLRVLVVLAGRVCAAALGGSRRRYGGVVDVEGTAVPPELPLLCLCEHLVEV